MGRLSALLILSLSASATAANELGEPDPDKVYLFYLHGRIIEEAGPTPVHEAWGRYDYPAVVEALKARGAVVVSEQRAKDTDVGEYAAKVLTQIDLLIQAGVPAAHIGVVGFSKGGSIAIAVSALPANRHVGIRYVFLAACADWLSDQPHLSLKGHVLSIRELSDDAVSACKPISEYGENLDSLSEMTIATGAEHGAFFLPRAEWVTPVLQWIHGG